ncbi:hypothetical protein [Deinococcus sp. QL22]|uniref:hypothetical protein n=1 Tax=Deinococcus sp. QL22 TaxID=2939437 RepID=UPI002017D350|nr:hypothetical protein [Deinococcus sp. QL22]UQN10181.1 hypothetical protein M1R55_27785 [Deinococcus sp. QL22]
MPRCEQAWAVQDTWLEGVSELWIRSADDLPGAYLITGQHAYFLGRVLEAV